MSIYNGLVDPASAPLRPSWKSHLAASGKTLSGPTLLGAVARATITQTEPMIWAKARVAHTCNRDRVYSKVVRKARHSRDKDTHLEKDHTKTDTLNSVEYAEPQPERDAEVGTSVTSPRDVQSQRGCTPQHLTPSRCAQADSEHGEKPCVRHGQPGENTQHQGPDTNEERDDQQENLPLRDGYRPQERPVTAVGLEQMISTDQEIAQNRHSLHSASNHEGFQSPRTRAPTYA